MGYSLYRSLQAKRKFDLQDYNAVLMVPMMMQVVVFLTNIYLLWHFSNELRLRAYQDKDWSDDKDFQAYYRTVLWEWMIGLLCGIQPYWWNLAWCLEGLSNAGVCGSWVRGVMCGIGNEGMILWRILNKEEKKVQIWNWKFGFGGIEKKRRRENLKNFSVNYFKRIKKDFFSYHS